MNRLHKNFSGQKKTVEAMINACGGLTPSCMCDSMIDCACGIEQHALQQSKYSDWLRNYKSAFKNAKN